MTSITSRYEKVYIVGCPTLESKCLKTNGVGAEIAIWWMDSRPLDTQSPLLPPQPHSGQWNVVLMIKRTLGVVERILSGASEPAHINMLDRTFQINKLAWGMPLGHRWSRFPSIRTAYDPFWYVQSLRCLPLPSPASPELLQSDASSDVVWALWGELT